MIMMANGIEITRSFYGNDTFDETYGDTVSVTKTTAGDRVQAEASFSSGKDNPGSCPHFFVFSTLFGYFSLFSWHTHLPIKFLSFSFFHELSHSILTFYNPSISHPMTF